MIKERIKELIKFKVNFEIVKQNDLVLAFKFCGGYYQILHDGRLIDSYTPKVLTMLIDKPKLVIKQVRQIALFDTVVF